MYRHRRPRPYESGGQAYHLARLGAMPGEKSAFGDVEKAARVYAINELMPVMEAMKHINDWLGEEVIRFNPYALLDTQPTS